MIIYSIPFIKKANNAGEALNESRFNSREFINDVSKNFFII